MRTYLKISKSIPISNFYIVKVRALDGRDSLDAIFYILLCDILLRSMHSMHTV